MVAMITNISKIIGYFWPCACRLAIIFFGVVSMASCGGSDGASSSLADNFMPPDCNGTLFTEGVTIVPESETSYEYDEYYYDLGLPPTYGIGRGEWIVHTSEGLPEGFAYYEDNKGGIGNTLDIIGCSGSMYMVWIGGGLHEISVRGSSIITDRGVGIGDTKEKFIELYPESTYMGKPSDSYFLQQGEIWATIHFRVNIAGGYVKYMETSATDFTTTLTNPASAIGPKGSNPWP